MCLNLHNWLKLEIGYYIADYADYEGGCCNNDELPTVTFKPQHKDISQAYELINRWSIVTFCVLYAEYTAW